MASRYGVHLAPNSGMALNRETRKMDLNLQSDILASDRRRSTQSLPLKTARTLLLKELRVVMYELKFACKTILTAAETL